MLAIVIPYYKLTFFEATLQSLANQTDKRFKVYIGNDASPENPTNLLEKYKGLFEFVYHRFDSNLGGISLVKQWERCVEMVGDEEWLMIMGDDDYLDENLVAFWYEKYNIFNIKSEVIRFASKLIVEETNTVSDAYVHPVWENATDSFYRKFQNLTRSSLSEYIFSRISYVKYGFHDYPLAWNSDDRAWLEFSNNKPIFTINESIVFVRISMLNISGRSDNVIEKNLSVIAFYKFIISNKLELYNKKQRDGLMRRYENEIKNVRNLRIEEWFFLLFIYIKNFNLSKKFLKRFLNGIFKRHES
ncbi:glycosyltransferase [Flavobacterium sp. LB3P122]|uniref:glycosyltransferase n=1 Tax=Flavobacterium algoriphilum TaxID=3398738 RepID=UPI003A8B1946